MVGICERQSAVLIHAIGVRSVPLESEEERAVTGVEREGGVYRGLTLYGVG